MIPLKKRYIIRLSGIVQGVGYRPFVYRKALEHNICGWVNNTGAAVIIDAEGEEYKLRIFIAELIRQPPVLASVEKFEITQEKLKCYESFEIRQSTEEMSTIRFISQDIGVCAKCMEEVSDPNSRRYRYAFTNCTDCGPRYSIIKSLPYDRHNTVMKNFRQCGKCSEEYNNPRSRRYHTQPNCCSDCGPSLFLTDCRGNAIDCDDPITKTVEFVKEGRIAAIKGIGGFHLCCDAFNPEAINELRRRKSRPHKPFAVMAANINYVLKHCELSSYEQELLSSVKRPIVLLKKKENSLLPGSIAPGLKRLGMMLPYSPLYYLLFEEGINMLIMTSGNIGGSPIQYENREAIQRLNEIADFFLLHNRDIYNPIDDSVVKVAVGKEMVSRRARGYIPYAQKLSESDEILALGAEEKSTICLSHSGYAYMSRYLGDLKDFDTYEQFISEIEKLSSLYQFKPKVYVHDLHPQYMSSRYAVEQQGGIASVQHHHAHMASCMMEHKLYDNVIGVVFDGTGLGDDGSIWGGEFLLGNRKSFQRAGHLKTVLLQDGDTAIKEPWRCAAAYLLQLGYDPEDFLKDVSTDDIKIIRQALASNLNCHLSSSMGRLFDCTAYIIGIRQSITYDAQAAIELENIIDASIGGQHYSYSINEKNNILELDYSGIISDLLTDRKCSIHASVMSAKFHNTISKATVEMLIKLRERHQINQIVLSGGVFENTYLLESVYKKLKDEGFTVYFNQQVPINDSGISVGQLAVAAEAVGR